jgi:hypothetical protein
VLELLLDEAGAGYNVAVLVALDVVGWVLEDVEQLPSFESEADRAFPEEALARVRLCDGRKSWRARFSVPFAKTRRRQTRPRPSSYRKLTPSPLAQSDTTAGRPLRPSPASP